MDNQPIITLRGDKIALGPVRRELLPLYQLWMNQLSTTRFLRMGIYSLENEQQWYENVASGDGIAYFTIYELATMKPIGGVDLHAISALNRTAELGIMIGDAESRGKGYGTEAVRLMCDWGFNAMGLHSIMLLTFAWNVAGQKAYTRAGFREFGRRRDARWFAGQYWDDIYYDILTDEFESPVVRDMLLEGIEFPSRSS